MLVDYPTVNTSPGRLGDKESSPPGWVGTVLGMSRLLQADTVVTAERRSDFAPIATILGVHVFDGLWTMAFNTSSFLEELSVGEEMDSNGKEIIDRRNYTGFEVSAPGLVGNLEQIGQKYLWSKNPFTRTSLFNNGYGNILQSNQIKRNIPTNTNKPKPTTTDKETLVEKGKGKDLKTVDQNFSKPGDSIEKYIIMQTIEYSGKGKQYRTRTITASALEKEIDNEKKVANYRLWTMGQIMEPKLEDNKSFHGPIEFSRKLDNEMVSFKIKGFGIIEQVLNQTIVQVKKYNPRKNTWKEKITIDLAGKYLPQELEYNLYTKIVDYGNKNFVLIIEYKSSPFTFKSLEDNISFVQCRSNGIAVYSLDKNLLYQHSFKFKANLNGESILVEELGYLSNNDAKLILPVLDECKPFKLAEKPLKVEKLTELPSWGLQSILAQQISSAAGFGIGERGTNPAVAITTIGYTAEKIVKDGWQRLLDTLKAIRKQVFKNVLEELRAINRAYKEYSDWAKENWRKLMEGFKKTEYLRINNFTAETDFMTNVAADVIAELVKDNIKEFLSFEFPVEGAAGSAISSGFILLSAYFLAKDLYKTMVLYQELAECLPYAILAYDYLLSPPPPPSQIKEPIKVPPDKKKTPKPPKKFPIKPILIGAGVVAAGGIGALVENSIGENGIDITGKWNLEFYLDFHSLGYAYGGGDITINSDGTIGYPSNIATCTYTVNGSNIRMELHIPRLTSPHGDVADAYYIHTGEIHDKNNMSGDSMGTFDWSWGTERYYGKWSAKRL